MFYLRYGYGLPDHDFGSWCPVEEEIFDHYVEVTKYTGMKPYKDSNGNWHLEFYL